MKAEVKSSLYSSTTRDEPRRMLKLIQRFGKHCSCHLQRFGKHCSFHLQTERVLTGLSGSTAGNRRRVAAIQPIRSRLSDECQRSRERTKQPAFSTQYKKGCVVVLKNIRYQHSYYFSVWGREKHYLILTFIFICFCLVSLPSLHLFPSFLF